MFQFHKKPQGAARRSAANEKQQSGPGEADRSEREESVAAVPEKAEFPVWFGGGGSGSFHEEAWVNVTFRCDGYTIRNYANAPMAGCVDERVPAAVGCFAGRTAEDVYRRYFQAYIGSDVHQVTDDVLQRIDELIAFDKKVLNARGAQQQPGASAAVSEEDPQFAEETAHWHFLGGTHFIGLNDRAEGTSEGVYVDDRDDRAYYCVIIADDCNRKKHRVARKEQIPFADVPKYFNGKFAGMNEQNWREMREADIRKWMEIWENERR